MPIPLFNIYIFFLEGKLSPKAGALGFQMGSNWLSFPISIVNDERKLMFQNLKW